MSIVPLLTGWTIDDPEPETHIRTYSTVGDILAYQRCRRQYGHFNVRRWSASTSTQRYFGVLMHDVLDRINRDYQHSHALPTPDEVAQLVTQAHDRLVRSGIKAHNATEQQALANKLIGRFVQLVGPHFFAYVQETEYRLERALKTHTDRDYILEGVVDVLSGAVSHALGLSYATTVDDVEIWDYKSGQAPKKGDKTLIEYEYQMRVYAELYRQQRGDYPDRCVLVFVGELGDDAAWTAAGGDPAGFPRLFYAIEPKPKHIDVAMQTFNETVEEIEGERAKSYGKQWDPPPPGVVPEQTCTVCDLRFNCDGYPQGRKLREQAL